MTPQPIWDRQTTQYKTWTYSTGQTRILKHTRGSGQSSQLLVEFQGSLNPVFKGGRIPMRSAAISRFQTSISTASMLCRSLPLSFFLTFSTASSKESSLAYSEGDDEGDGCRSDGVVDSSWLLALFEGRAHVCIPPESDVGCFKGFGIVEEQSDS